MVEENGIKIDSGEILSSLECSVCCSEYSEPTLAKCGHTFCKACIEECINRNHECPECKRTITKDDISRNYQIERIQRHIHDLHDKEKKDLVDTILALEGNLMKSPIVSIFKANQKDSLIKFERYCEDAKRELEESKKKSRAKFAKAESVIDQSVILKLKEEESKDTHIAEHKYNLAMDYILQTYERYLKEALPNPKSLPIKISVSVPSKGLRLDNIPFRPDSCMREIRLLVEKEFKNRSETVVKWEMDVVYLIVSPIQKSSGSETKIVDEKQQLIDCKLYPGSCIEIQGTIKLESEVQKPCITLTFNKEAMKMYNYYSCDTCSLNWICEPCIQQCHKGHSLKEYLKNHVPTWACCYCLKKKCLLPNKNNPLGIK